MLETTKLLFGAGWTKITGLAFIEAVKRIVGIEQLRARQATTITS